MAVQAKKQQQKKNDKIILQGYVLVYNSGSQEGCMSGNARQDDELAETKTMH